MKPTYEGLRRAEEDIASGHLGIARDRLHGLVVSFPDDLSLRIRLGDVYDQLGYPIEAGRLWFLEPDPTAHQLDAIQKFVKACRGDPDMIATNLKLRVEDNSPIVEAARERIEYHTSKSPTAIELGGKRRALQNETASRKSRAINLGCSIIGFWLALTAMIGSIKMIQMIIDGLR